MQGLNLLPGQKVKKNKKDFFVDQSQSGNYLGLCGMDFPALSSAGLPIHPTHPTRNLAKPMIDPREESLWKMLESGNPDLIPIATIAALSAWGLPARSKLCAAGKIPAIKVADQWFSTSKMVLEALKMRHERDRAQALAPPTQPRKVGRPRTRA